ncbi:hypothetical protein KGF56_002431 [Candida oxycetoniae]|uniref:Uncharacterized protein n=1 Tax=Candida oxycetoniae TaxID=497107 RepID=A0AAI9WYG6_9ASCO|nr:uncharacterized protein KGF56_002431 [Candida oxycetoniae]KAI3404801.1 hypothetical protein KGF56_002431 [Candida oxycetoniae]
MQENIDPEGLVEDDGKKVEQPVPLSKLKSNIYHNLPNPIQSTLSVPVRVEEPTLEPIYAQSLSSNEEFYEASPVLDEDELYFPSLFEETNFPTVFFPTQPHMSKPLQDNAILNLQKIPIMCSPRSFPLDSDPVKTNDVQALHNILSYEFKNTDPTTSSWWCRQDPWSQFIERDQEQSIQPANKRLKEEVNLDQIFINIYQ